MPPPEPVSVSCDETPAFSPGRIALDPLLAGHEANAIYQAFRQRRCRLRRKSPFLFWIIGLYAIGIPLLFFLPFFFIQYFFSVENDFYLVYVVLYCIIIYLIPIPSPKNHAISSYVSTILVPNEVIEPATTDLWMTGTSGRDLMEALYLESAEGNTRAAVVTASGIGLVLGGTLLWFLKPPLVLAALILTATGFLLREFLLIGWSTGFFGIGRWVVSQRIRYWDSPTPRAEAIGTRIAIWVGVFIVFQVFFGFVLVMVIDWGEGFVAFLMGRESAPLRFVGANLGALCILFVLGAAAFLLLLIRDTCREMNVEGTRKLFARANRGFAVFMARTVVGDADGERWARAQFDSPSGASSEAPAQPVSTD